MLSIQVVRPENATRFEHVSLGDYLRSNGYSDAFVHNYILPMCAAVLEHAQLQGEAPPYAQRVISGLYAAFHLICMWMTA